MSAAICGGIERAHLSIDSRRIGSDLGFAALREAAKGNESRRNAATRFADTSSVELPSGPGSGSKGCGTGRQREDLQG